MILAIYGTGGAGKETYLIAHDIQDQEHRWSEIVFIDDTLPVGYYKKHRRMPFEKFTETFPCNQAEVHIAIGELTSRQILADKVKRHGYKLATIIHPDAIIEENVVIRDGVQVKMGTKIGSNTKIEEGTWIQAYVTIGDNNNIGKYCQISAKSSLSNKIMIDDHVFVGMHANIGSSLHIYEYAVISMGTSVFNDVEHECICMGNPGRIMAKNKSHTVF